MPREPESMYRWRRMNATDRAHVLKERREQSRPWHSPPHIKSETTSYYMVTAACFEHTHVIGQSSSRMSSFESKLLSAVSEFSKSVFAWCLLPNHYHVLVHTVAVDQLLWSLGRLHGRTSFQWNREDAMRGKRKVWCGAAETAMKSTRHFYASMNYVLNNAVHHGYVDRWTDWPYCNATEYLNQNGRESVLRQWNEYPIREYGKSWDPKEM